MASESTNKGWINTWEEGRSPWHRPQVHPMLEKYLDKVIAGRHSCRIFFPLCGKAVDMKWLADKGHTVVGVELSGKGIKQFFQEQNVEYDVSPVENLPDAELYKSKDGKILIYKADLFAVSRDVLGTFGGMWDRGSLVAIDKEDRERYVDLMASLMAPDCNYLLSTFDYDMAVMKGPPHCIPDSEVRRLYADHVNIEILDTRDCMTDRWRDRGHKWMTQSTSLITHK
ncbi:probable thiopurine S-methyltransferase isoform X2 [Amphiura filiformis]|uniref:probable thiopurine S-methyltransferase isoform X2 n=1 Tax=Amphiura filiformis TaxID=82378 RepID=UPI003B22254A